VSGEFALSAAISEDRERASVAVARKSAASGKTVVDIRFYDSPRLVVAWLSGAYAFSEPAVLVVNPKSQSGTLVEPLRAAGIIAVEVSAEDVAVAHGEFLDLVGGGDLEHLGQRELTDAVRAAQQRSLAGAKAWEPRLATDQGPLVAATLAVWGFRRHEEMASPGAWQI
jgi:hypothetical protein